tara:strand:- start:45 stop:1199 length:1155 start_codon:yes stop_codon:yes gene_type:complete
MILANGCSHTHGTKHAEIKNYKDKLWPNIAGEVLGDTNVINLAKGGDSNMCIADSTIHWLETNTIKPDMVIVQWTYKQRFELPFHRKYPDDPFRDSYTAEPISHGEEPPVSDSWIYLNQYPREGINWLTSTSIYVEKNQENDMLEKDVKTHINHLGLEFPNILYQAGFKQDIHPYYLDKNDDPRIQSIIDYYKRYVDYREAVCNLPTVREYTLIKWAQAQSWLASYCKARNIPYYWWGVDSWRDSDMADVFYLKPKHGEMFSNIVKIDTWLEKQGIIANGDVMEFVEGHPYVDDHRGEDGHKYIGKMIGNFIKHGIEPDPNAEDRELLKKNLLARPNLKTGGGTGMVNQYHNYEALWKFANGGVEYEDIAYLFQNLNPPNFYYD